MARDVTFDDPQETPDRADMIDDNGKLTTVPPWLSEDIANTLVRIDGARLRLVPGRAFMIAQAASRTGLGQPSLS